MQTLRFLNKAKRLGSNQILDKQQRAEEKRLHPDIMHEDSRKTKLTARGTWQNAFDTFESGTDSIIIIENSDHCKFTNKAIFVDAKVDDVVTSDSYEIAFNNFATPQTFIVDYVVLKDCTMGDSCIKSHKLNIHMLSHFSRLQQLYLKLEKTQKILEKTL